MSDVKSKKDIFEIQRIYIKDISFEAPNTPDIFHHEWKPNVNLKIDHSVEEIEKNIFEIILKINLIVKIKEKLVFLCDLDQAGIFFITNVNEKKLKYCLHAYSPNILFPYARTCIANLIAYGSFPQMHLAPINFDALYNNYIKSKKI